MIKYLNEHEKKQLFLQITNDSSKYHIRNKAIFLLAKFCALRAGEISLIKWNCFNIHKKSIYCQRLKNGNNNTLLIIDPDVLTAIEEYYNLINPNPSEYMFCSQKGTPISRKTLDSLMKKYCKGTNIDSEKHHFHVLRHTRAIELGEAGIDVKDIQWWLGHKNINNTLIYLQFTTAQQKALYIQLLQYQKNSSLYEELRKGPIAIYD